MMYDILVWVVAVGVVVLFVGVMTWAILVDVRGDQ